MYSRSLQSTLRSRLESSGSRPSLRGRFAVKVFASYSERSARPENVDGSFYVDHTCIDCDTCRWMAPSFFARVDGLSAVVKQPATKPERIESIKALLSCPTNSIHSRTMDKAELKEAKEGLPAPVPGCDGVFHCGWHSTKSYAATSYLIVREEGNIMVDSPRYTPTLAQQIERLGGVKYIFLTHKDDIADHEAWAKQFKAQRIMHTLEIEHGTRGVELKLEGEGPWRLPDAVETVGTASDSSSKDGDTDVEILFTPGHTEGHLCLLHRPSQSIFTGDHLAATSTVLDGDLVLFKRHNWYSFEVQLASVAALRKLPYRHILPGHGRIAHFDSFQEKEEAIGRLLEQHSYAIA